MSAFLAIIFLGSILIFLAILSGTAYAIFKIGKAGLSRADRADQADEARIIQDLHQSLEQMEARIEVLETILMESQKKKESA